MNTLMTELDRLIASKHLLNHPFYHAWNRGQLSKECLQEYALEYYHHVKAFPTYLSQLHCHIEDPEKRKVILKNLIEEEAGSPNHPDLWREFGTSLGVTQGEWSQHQPCLAIQKMIGLFKDHCKNEDETIGIAALYAYESQIPSISESKIAGLKKFYGMDDLQGYKYFEVHIEADKEHALEERALILSSLTTHNFDKVREAVEKTLNSLWDFLSYLSRKYHIRMACI